jgi:hypothetical protein
LAISGTGGVIGTRAAKNEALMYWKRGAPGSWTSNERENKGEVQGVMRGNLGNFVRFKTFLNLYAKIFTP